MHHRNNLYLIGMIAAVFFMFSCSSGNVINTSKNSTSTTSSPTPAGTPSMPANIKEFKTKIQELCDFIVKDRLDPKAKIKGKVALVQINNSRYCSLDVLNKEETDFDTKTLEAYGLTKDDMALKLEDINTLVQNKCSQGKQIGTYTLESGRAIPAYQLDCEVSVIDYKNRATVAMKKFVGKELDKSIQTDNSITEKNAYMPSKEIEKYIKSLREK